MTYFIKWFAGLFSILLITGCIGENYDYTPPTVLLSNSDTELEEANINWDTAGDPTEDGSVKTDDIFALAKEQTLAAVKAGEQDSIEFDSQDFLLETITISVWKDDKETELTVDQKFKEFTYPTEKGHYVVEVNLDTDRGTAQYVGNILVD